MNAQGHIELSIIIVNWNSWFHLSRCLSSIMMHAGEIPYEIIVVDNNSQDGSVANLKREFPVVCCLALDKNVGFPKATNLGLSIARGSFLLALNPDTEVFAQTMQESISFLKQHGEYGCLGVKTIKPNGKIQLDCGRRKMTLRGVIFETLMLDKIFPRLAWLQSPAMTEWDHETDRDVDIIQGAYMMFPKAIFHQLGGLDETIQMFYEDMEFCLRLAEHGYKIRYLSQVRIVHYIGQSTGQAVAGWISDLRFEAYFLALKKIHGQATARWYPVLLLLALPWKILISPGLAAAILIKNGNNRFKSTVLESCYGLIWALRKIASILQE